MTAFAARLSLVLTLGLLGLLTLPVALVPVPPVLDYPNHFARLCLIAGELDKAPLRDFYEVDWSATSTNIAIDLIAALVGPSLGCETLARFLLAAAILAPAAGAVALHAAIFRGPHWWQLSFALLAWSSTAVAGFLNFQIALGLALFAAAVDQAIRPRSHILRLALRVVLGVPVLVCHICGSIFLGALLAGLDFGPASVAWRDPAAWLRRLARAFAGALSGFGVPVAIFYMLAPVIPGAANQAPATYGLKEKLVVIAAPFLTYDVAVDFLFVAGLLIVTWLAIRLGDLRVHAGVALAGAGCAALALIVPRDVLDGSLLDWRFAIMAAMMVTLAMRPEVAAPPAVAVATVLLAVLAIGRTAWIWRVWEARSADVAAVERAISAIPPGVALLPARADDAGAAPVGRNVLLNLPADLHYALLAIPRRGAFVPTLFAMPGQQPVRVRPGWVDRAAFSGHPAPLAMLTAEAAGSGAALPAGVRYLRDWPRHFDYLLLLNAEDAGPLDPAIAVMLEPVADEGFARLWRIRR